MSIFYVCIDPPRKSPTYKKLKAHYNKVGVKMGYFSWAVKQRDLKKRLLMTLEDRMYFCKIPGTLATIRKTKVRGT